MRDLEIRNRKGNADWRCAVRFFEPSRSQHGLVDVWKRSPFSAHGPQEIGAVVNYRAIHLLTFFRKTFGFEEGLFPIAERIGDSTISIPFHPKLPHETSALLMRDMKGLCTAADRDAFKDFFGERAKQFQGGPRTYEQTLEAIGICVASMKS